MSDQQSKTAETGNLSEIMTDPYIKSWYNKLSEDGQVLFDERAAIMEQEGKLSRVHAERHAQRIVNRQIRLDGEAAP